MTTLYNINLDFRCNERCVFCAADLGGDVPVEVRRPSLTLEQIRQWLGDSPPGRGDRVLLSGGEPTLHRELLPIARYLSTRCRDVLLFTNGLRLADVDFARATAQAGISRYEISLYGPDATTHDAVTRRPGSFDGTLRALRALVSLRAEFDIFVSVRLLVSRTTAAANADIVRRVADDVGSVDCFSLNRLILSNDAMAAGAPISWLEARASVNQCARVVRELGYRLEFDAIPLCVFNEDNAPWVIAEAAKGLRRLDGGLGDGHVSYRYLDPLFPAGTSEPKPRRRAALPDVCLGCDLSTACMRVDRDYLRLFGEAGLRPVPAEAVAVALGR